MARIIVVEDDGALRNDLADRLASWGHEVRQAADGLEGFDAIVDFQPDLVLSDIHMPSASGLELLREVKAGDDRFGDVAFVFISSQSETSAMVHGIGSGADDYITKPIDYDLLEIKVKSHLRKRSAIYAVAISDRMADTMARSLFKVAFSASAFIIIGLIGLLVLYWTKVALGIDLFQQSHLSDWF